MPSSAPQVKKDAVAAYGGTIIESEPTLEARENAATAIQQQHGAAFIHPSNDMHVILGQATAGIERLKNARIFLDRI